MNLGLAILRVGIGIFFIIHGYPKIVGGIDTWVGLVSSLSLFWPGFWGFMAAFSEFFGGILLVIGFYPRLASLFLAITMVFAVVSHFIKGDGFLVYSHAMELCIVFISLILMGGGPYNIRRFFSNKETTT